MRWIQDPKTLELVPATEFAREVDAPFVWNDITPYKSMVDGSIIGSRSTHREHLRQHNCVEVGNETKYLKPKEMKPPPGLKETLIRVANEKLRSR